MPKTSGWILIDTSAWIHALRPDGLPRIRLQVREALIQGRAATCEMIILELLRGARTDKEHTDLYEELSSLHQFSITDLVWNRAYGLARDLRHKGISIPAADQLIASVALVHACTILHFDKHFDVVAGHS